LTAGRAEIPAEFQFFFASLYPCRDQRPIASSVGAANNASLQPRAAHREGILTTLFDLTGRVAIVTGSSRGIGRAIAERLAEHGAMVVISSRKADACAETAAAVNRARGREAAMPIAANISSTDGGATIAG
jgi:3-oxoacyl-ACP reductase-like protein